MSSTRTAQPGSTFRQERYCSSAEFERGLMATLVAKRCGLIDDPKQREAIWFLQLLSHREGGLERVASTLLARYPERIATAAMQRLGAKPGQIYSAAQVREVRAEIPLGNVDDDFLLRGEFDSMHLMGHNSAEDEAKAEVLAAGRPTSHPASAFVARCASIARDELANHLREICLNPQARPSSGPWYFPDLFDTILEFAIDYADQVATSTVTTSLGFKVSEALDYALSARCLVVIDGLERMGKTVSAKTWCEMNPGRARYVQVPSSNDDILPRRRNGAGSQCQFEPSEGPRVTRTR